MQPAFLLLILRAVTVLVAPGPEEGCPSARQVSAALASRVSATLKTRKSDPDTTLTVILAAPGSAQEPSFSLVDEQGRLRLFRTLTRPGNPKPQECSALAETVALIVQRYLEEVELPEIEATAPPPPPKPPSPSPPRPQPVPPTVSRPAPTPSESGRGPRARWDLSLGFAARFANQQAGWESLDLGRFTIARSLGSRSDKGMLLALWAGVSGVTGWGSSANQDGGQARLIRIPTGLALMWRHMVSEIELQLGASGLMDLWVLGATYKDQIYWNTQMAFSAAALGGLQLPLSQRFFVRIGLEFAMSATRYRYIDLTHSRDATFTTPLFFASAGLALGMSLR